MFSFKCIHFQKRISVKDYIKGSCLKKTQAYEPHISIEEKNVLIEPNPGQVSRATPRLLMAFFKVTEALNVVNTTTG